MKAVCDSCERAAAVLFCPIDEAVFCGSCDKRVHQHAGLHDFNCQERNCIHVACGHERYSLVDPGKFAECELCGRQPAFFHCEEDAISLCLKCDALIHNAARKKRHARFLILSQQVQLVGSPAPARRFHMPPLEPNMVEAEIGGGQNQPPVMLEIEEGNYQQNMGLPPLPVVKAKRRARIRGRAKVGFKSIDLNRRARRSAASKNKKKGR